MTDKYKKKILIDLDGVLNIYTGEYTDKFIPPAKEGALDFIKQLSKEYRIVIFTSRNLFLTSKWLINNKFGDYIENVTNTKEPCYLIIDDRCINFSGNYSDLKDKINNFQVWYKNI